MVTKRRVTKGDPDQAPEWKFVYAGKRKTGPKEFLHAWYLVQEDGKLEDKLRLWKMRKTFHVGGIYTAKGHMLPDGGFSLFVDSLRYSMQLHKDPSLIREWMAIDNAAEDDEKIAKLEGKHTREEWERLLQPFIVTMLSLSHGERASFALKVYKELCYHI